VVSVPVASPPLDEITTALLDLFRLSGRTVYDGAYGGDPVKATYPYGILYAVAGGLADPMPDLDKRGDEITAAWQATAVSKLRNQAQQLQRALRDLLLARDGTGGWLYPITVPAGWVCIDRTADPVPGGVRSCPTTRTTSSPWPSPAASPPTRRGR
jgi:hypothetical protein